MGGRRREQADNIEAEIIITYSSGFLTDLFLAQLQASALLRDRRAGIGFQATASPMLMEAALSAIDLCLVIGLGFR